MSSRKRSKKARNKMASPVSESEKSVPSPMAKKDKGEKYQVLRGLQTGERYTTKPVDLVAELSLKGMFAYIKKKCILSEGILKVFGRKSGDVKHVIDLGVSVVAYSIPKRRISINTDIDMFRFQAVNVDNFTQWVGALYMHRLYRQDRIQYSEPATSDVDTLRSLSQELRTKLLKINVEVQHLSDGPSKSKESIMKHTAEALELQQKYENVLNKMYGPPTAKATKSAIKAAKILPETKSPTSDSESEVQDEEKDESEAEAAESSQIATSSIIPSETVSPTSGKKEPGIFRDKLSAPMVACTVSIWDILKSAIGKDLTKISFPIEMFEPVGLLQVLCEGMEYSNLLDTAIETDDPAMRMALVAAFAVSRYASTTTRTFRKPFNPLEGETYENIRDDMGWVYFAEQVTHHPPVSAAICRGAQWEWSENSSFDLAFWGRSVVAEPKTPVDLILKKFKENYRWNKVKTSVNNLIAGTRYIDHYGTMLVKCSNKMNCKLTFKQNTHEVVGNVTDPQGTLILSVYGKWSESFNVKSQQQSRCIWTKTPFPANSSEYYGFTRFAITLNELTPELHGFLPPTDSRLRPDQRFFEEGRVAEAKEQKELLENNQRTRRKTRDYKPLWFNVDPNARTGKKEIKSYRFNNRYWAARKSHFQGITFDKLWQNIT